MGKPKQKPPKAKRPARRRIVRTAELVSVGFPLGPRPKEMREWSAAQFLRWKREARQANASELVQVVPAVGGQIPGAAQRRPLPKPSPHPGGAPAGQPRSFTDEALRAARDARTIPGHPLTVMQQQEIAQVLGAHLRTIQRRLKALPK